MANNLEPVTTYHTATGKILLVTYRVDGVNPTLGVGESLIDGHYDGDEMYISSGVPTFRPTLLEITDGSNEVHIDLQVGVNQTIISNMPVGTIVSTEDDFYDVTTVVENLDIRAERMGEFDFEIIPPFPYIALNFTVVISDAG